MHRLVNCRSQDVCATVSHDGSWFNAAVPLVWEDPLGLISLFDLRVARSPASIVQVSLSKVSSGK